MNIEDKTVNDLSFTSLLEELNTLKSNISSTIVKTKKLESTVTKQLKQFEKKKNKKGGVRAPSGFAKPTPLSDELCLFLKVASGTELARTDVTKRITEYIKEHNLQNLNDKRIILPDKTLKKLLFGNGKMEDVTYFNLQKYLKHHFPKKETLNL